MAAGNRHGTTHQHTAAMVMSQQRSHIKIAATYTLDQSAANGAHQMLLQTAILLHPVDQSSLGCQRLHVPLAPLPCHEQNYTSNAGMRC